MSLKSKQTSMLQGVNLFLIGMMGAGKSTVGKLAAQRLGYHFIDTDDTIESYAGKSIPQIFADSGEAEFRQIEHNVLMQVSAYRNLVVATGGGIVVDRQNWAHLHSGVVAWLDVPIEVLHQRLTKNNGKRPLLQVEDPMQRLTNLYNQRLSLYQQADIQVAIPDDSAAELVCDCLMAELAAAIVPDRLKQPQQPPKI
ncbi:shikimate kinase [Thalassoporum mexicanum PCC 7367]|uniref:shikimate kinase n=1 Tax=Thalassoporum mexicanum TaxID=3457544 RepID=UPI00029FD8C3|nr:shikimate kinase [Pseudanabaena sp. PCC 7367]AFY71011.1 shikimate kinase [Pseudanabaena sp. PCC 7367]